MSLWRSITKIYEKQYKKGLKEYGRTLEENNDLSVEELLLMALEETVDASLYIAKAFELLKKDGDDRK